MTSDQNFLAAFEATELGAENFNHEAHVRAAFLILKKNGFARAVPVFCEALQALTRRFGMPEKYHETITIAFLALINERLADTPNLSWRDFRGQNSDILSGNILGAYYTPEELASPIARRVFQLPRKNPA